MRKLYLLISLLVIQLSANATEADTSIFTNDYEKKLFLINLNNPALHGIEWFVACQHTSECPSYIEKYNQFISKLRSDSKSWSVKKKLKTIYKLVHEEFLKKYEEESYFNDIFLNGNYNCVGASALYAMVLKDLSIPYVIKETSDHVYLIADPEQEDFRIETTLVTDGLVHYDSRFMKSYIDYLHNNKMISDEEFANSSTENLFSKYYLTDKSINLKELAGLQYYNKAAFLFDKSLYYDALKNIEKAQLLYPSDRIMFSKNGILLNLLKEENNAKKFDGRILALYLTSSPKDKDTKAIVTEYFNMMTDELVINHPNLLKYDQVFSDFRRFADTVSIIDFAQTYHFYRGYSYYLQSDYSAALDYLKQAYAVNQDNLKSKQLIIEIVMKILHQHEQEAICLDSADKFMQFFPFLRTDRNMKYYLCNLYSNNISAAYMSGNETSGNKHLGTLERLVMETPDSGDAESELTQVYVQMAMYYYNKLQDTPALEAVKRGLKYLPNSAILKERYQYISTHPLKASPKSKPVSSAGKKDMIFPQKKEVSFMNRDSLDANIRKFLPGRWKSVIVHEGTQKAGTKEDETFFTFFENETMLMELDGIQITGQWKYNPSVGSILLNISSEQLVVELKIMELKVDKLTAVVTDPNEKSEISTMEMTKIP